VRRTNKARARKAAERQSQERNVDETTTQIHDSINCRKLKGETAKQGLGVRHHQKKDGGGGFKGQLQFLPAIGKDNQQKKLRNQRIKKKNNFKSTKKLLNPKRHQSAGDQGGVE